MERMGDILAKNATRRRAARGPLPPDANSDETPSPPARPMPTARLQRAASTAPLARRFAPRARVTPNATGLPTTSPAATPASRYRHLPDAQPRATSEPSIPVAPNADALNSDRILELPRRSLTTRRATLASGEARAVPADPAGDARGERGGDTRIVAPRPEAAPSRVSSEHPSERASRATGRAAAPQALRELAEQYAAGQAETRALSPRAARAQNAPRVNARQQSDPDVCPHCGGSGWVRLDVPVGDPAFGKAIACSCKERQQEEQRRSDLRQLSSLEPFSNKTFDSFDARVSPGLDEAFRASMEYAEQPQGWLVLRGGYGTGKTHLAAAIANYRLAAGSPVFFSIVPDLLDHLRGAFAPNSELTYDALFDRIREVELLVLDDLGAENGTAWASEKLFQLLNYRYNFRTPTVITTNSRLLSHMDDRIASRLSDVGLVQNVVIDAPDFRKRHTAGAPRAARRTGDSGSGGSGNARGRGNTYPR
ncbi:MAG TPA: ATP-binding protein [Ktedonobacterales bacterium]|nr:ATP-binding protein [Ktedonobacterales bacterium]